MMVARQCVSVNIIHWNLQKAWFYLGLPAHDVQFAAEIEYLILMSKMRRCILSSFKNHEKEDYYESIATTE